MSTLDSPIEEWDVATVQALLVSLGFPFHLSALEQNGVDGAALVHFDNDSLKDIGIQSVGQRLAILKAVYQYKLRDKVAFEPDHWKPQEEEQPEEPINTQTITQMLSERDARIKSLEHEVRKLAEQLSGFRDEVHVISKAVYTKDGEPFLRLGPRSRSPIGPNFPHPLSNAATTDPAVGLHRSNSLQHPSTSNFYASHPRPSTADTLSPHDSSPAPSPRDGPFSETLADHVLKAGGFGMEANAPPPLTPSGLPNSMSSPNTPTYPSPNHVQQMRSGSKESMGPSPAADLRPSTAMSTQSQSVASSSSRPQGHTAGSGQSADQIQRSFKVTLTDPCFKVLPAALKKYKIPDDWRNYALFICYGGGTTERCLSYDEKPLLLFQKLKDNGQEPVFMLRHIKDIKSPIHVASQKHAARRKRIKTKEDDKADDKDESNPHPFAMPTPGTAPAKGYCISIYPYMADRDDEFDVNVGDIFVIVSKAKGWWIVYRQFSRGAEKADADHKYAWVPAGCLLETSSSPFDISADGSTSSAPIMPNQIVSVSTPGVALMDYKATGSDELRLVNGDSLRVYKSWSYVGSMQLECQGRAYELRQAVKEDTGERGWAPSWFIGKILKKAEGGPPSLPALSSSGRTQDLLASPNSEVFSNPRTPNS